MAIISQDQATLRSAPRDSAQANAMLWQGETVEVRGERLDYLQVWDYKRERGGFVHASQAKRISLAPQDAPELLAVVRFLRDRPGSEALGIGYAAAYIQAAPAEVLQAEPGVEALDALGMMAERLARRASAGAAMSKAAQSALTMHIDLAKQYGVRFINTEREGRMQICYDGDAFRRVLAMQADAKQKARAALALTRTECMAEAGNPTEHRRLDEWRAEVLDRVDTVRLTGYLRNRVMMRRAGVWAALAYQRARKGEDALPAANRALEELAGVNKSELTDEDFSAYNDAAMRANASRWASVSTLVSPLVSTLVSATQPAAPASSGKRPTIATVPGTQPGETCVLLIDAKNGVDKPLAKRCTFSLVWANSATLNREGTALALAVQPAEAWRELWLFGKGRDGWSVRVLPPAVTMPDLGYAEFAGWVPGGAQMLVAREARGEGKYKHNFELLRLDTLSTLRQTSDASALGAFRRWQDPAWKSQSVALR